MLLGFLKDSPSMEELDFENHFYWGKKHCLMCQVYLFPSLVIEIPSASLIVEPNYYGDIIFQKVAIGLISNTKANWLEKKNLTVIKSYHSLSSFYILGVVLVDLCLF